MGSAWITGVCLRPNRLDWTVLRRTKESWDVHDFGGADLPAAGPGGEGGTATLKPYLKSFKGRISVALPTERVLLRVALLPSTDAEELRGMAELQTDKYSPFPVEDMALGAEVLEAAESSSLVAMAAVRRDVVEETGRLFQEMGVPPDVVDVEAMGWWWGLKHAGHVPSHGSQLFIRAEAVGMEMILSRDGAPLLFRSLPPLPVAGGEAALEEWVAESAEETGYSLTSLETEWGGASPPSLHVFHAPDLPVDWVEPFRQALGLEALFTHSLAELPPLSEGVAQRQAGPALPLRMDLAPEAWRMADVSRRMRRRMIQTGTLLLTAWLLGLGIFWTLLNVQRGRLNRLKAETETLEGPALEIRKLRAKTLELTQYANRTHSALECLRVLSEHLPMGVDLTSFIYRKANSLVLRGDADTPDKVYAFIQAMEQTGLFEEVRSDGVSTRTTPQGRRSQFGLTIQLPGVREEGG